ncbi:Lar family restriction alleviation protein [Achromobacter aegrifaciens]|uniref:Restriction alleviation protein, Lar family n=1 Tax=Achromobacter aegrifaciens TaxID=1287736 RepID=A0AAD2IZ62_ACHAE|nr:Lar family restriction alleviation protein [Achromobacter aegrifaciens]CUJ01617.1 restriction alleviation protein%2C Lar family [Achromobacter aegrifaciens]
MNTTLPAGWKPRLSCPFCGSNFLFTEPDEVGSGGQWVSPIHVGCNDCKAEQVGDTEDEAVSRWNARSTHPATTQDAITVSLDPDPRGVSVGVWQGSRCIYNGAHAVPSAQDDAKVYHFEQRSRFGPWIEVEKPTERSVEFVQRVAAPAAGDARSPALNIEAAAKALAECMDYPWAHMPEQGRATMREHAQTVIRAASQQQEG